MNYRLMSEKLEGVRVHWNGFKGTTRWCACPKQSQLCALILDVFYVLFFIFFSSQACFTKVVVDTLYLPLPSKRLCQRISSWTVNCGMPTVPYTLAHTTCTTTKNIYLTQKKQVSRVVVTNDSCKKKLPSLTFFYCFAIIASSVVTRFHPL